MGFPTVTIQIAFATNPSQTPTWVDVSSYVRDFTITRGRQHELDRTEAGTLTLTLDNRDRRFDPSYQAGLYYPNVIPLRRVQITATWNGVLYYLYNGYIESWPPDWPGAWDGIVQVQAVDAFKVLALKKLTQSLTQELTGSRVTDVLTAVGWTIGGAWLLGDATDGVLGSTTVLAPVGISQVDQGNSTMQAQSVANYPALSAIQDAYDVEYGMVFMNGRGEIVFRERNTRNQNIVSKATFGGAAGETPYTDIKMAYDDTQIWNDVQVTVIGGTMQEAQDTTSEAQYFTRTKAITNLPLYDAIGGVGGTAAGLANYVLGKYKQPKLRVTQLTTKPVADDAMWPPVLGLELDDVVTVHRTPQSLPGGPVIETQCFVEHIEHKYTPEYWESTFMFSPVNTPGYWLLGDAAHSQLGQTTVLSY